jgi:hypothetical protein
MAILEDRTKFLASDPTRLKIACWCSTEQLSRGEIASRLERASGSISAPDTMLRRRALIHAGFGDSGGSGRKARLLKLNPQWRESMQQALRLQRPAVLEPGTDLLLIPFTSMLSACEVLSQGVQEIDWGVQLSGEQIGLLLGTHSDPEGGATIRAVASLERAGVKPVRLRLQTPVAAEELRRWAVKVVGDETPTLESGRRDDAG